MANIHPNLARAPPGIRIESELAVAGKYIPAELIELQGLKHDRDNVKRKLTEAESRKRTGSSVMKKYYEKKEKTLLADLADIDSKMADIDQQLNRPGEGEGLSGDVVQEESLLTAVNCSLKAKKSDLLNFKNWYGDGQKKVVVKGSNESSLKQLQQHARDIGLVCSLVSDAGLTEVAPGTITCLGIGPAPESKVDEITGNLSLF